MNRRTFLSTTVATGAAAMMIPEIVKSAIPGLPDEESRQNIDLADRNAVILFQGDSITDGGRDKASENKPNDAAMLGQSYPLFAAAGLLAKCPDRDLRIYNRGISGNKIVQLTERWDRDCIRLYPNLLSILIGVNDYWHTRTGTYDGNLEVFMIEYRRLLENTARKLPNTKIIICEPFLIHGGSSLDASWEQVFQGYRAATGLLSKEFSTAFVPFQTVFNKALEKMPASYWGADGVHPSMAGAWLMAEAWLKVAFYELGVRNFETIRHRIRN
jgi:lysophospholipase L1-like esterase